MTDDRESSARPAAPVLRSVLLLATLVLPACSDDGGASNAPDGAVTDASSDAADDTTDASTDADEPSVDDGGADVADDAVDDAEADTDTDDPHVGGSGVPVNMGAPDIDLASVAGLRVEELTYVVPGLETERTLGLHIWYATDDTEGEGAMFLVARDEHAWRDATVSAPSAAEPAPMVVYSHGGRGFAGQISAVARQFVRNGWVFVAVPHPGDNLFDFTEDRPYAFPVLRAFDALEAIDYMENLPREHPLSGRVDTSKVLAMGHSFGGQNAWFLAGLALDLDGIRERCGDGCTAADIAAYEAFHADPRVVAAISMESLIGSNLIRDESFAELDAPILHMSGTESNDATELFDRAGAADLTWVSLIGGCHESFTGTLVCPTLDLAESLRTTAVYAIAFGTRHILGSSDPGVLAILDGSVEVSTSAELRRSPGAE